MSFLPCSSSVAIATTTVVSEQRPERKKHASIHTVPKLTLTRKRSSMLILSKHTRYPTEWCEAHTRYPTEWCEAHTRYLADHSREASMSQAILTEFMPVHVTLRSRMMLKRCMFTRCCRQALGNYIDMSSSASKTGASRYTCFCLPSTHV